MGKNKAQAPTLPRIRYTSCFDLTHAPVATAARLHMNHPGVADNSVGLGLLQSLFLYLINPNPRKIIACGKKRPKRHVSPNFSWVGMALGRGVVVGFMIPGIIYLVYVFEPNRNWYKVYRKHPNGMPAL